MTAWPETERRAEQSLVGPTANAAQVIRIEANRTGVAAGALVMVILGALVLATKVLPFAARGGWDSSWVGALAWLDNANVFFGPMVMTFAAWVGGRERRSSIGELLAVTSRPVGRRVSLTWLVVVLGSVAAVALESALVFLAVLPTSSYGGGRWVATWGLLLLNIAVFAGVGFAAGRLFAGRLLAPAIGLCAYVTFAWVTWPSSVRRFLPANGLSLTEGDQLRAGVIVGLAVLLLALSAAAVILAASRRRPLVAVPLLVALAVAVPLAGTSAWTEPDPAAQQSVCTSDDGPQVCVQRVHAGLLGAVTTIARKEMESVADLASWTSAQETALGTNPPPNVLALPSLQGQGRAFRQGLADPAGYGRRILNSLPYTTCDPDDPAATRVTAIDDAVAAALLQKSGAGLNGLAAAVKVHRRLSADPAVARAWMTDYLAAASTCDLAVLKRLARS